jgi:hypothetical protein
MAQDIGEKDMRASTAWFIIGSICGVITIISALGEWVFHWWQDPGDWLAMVGLLLTLVSFGLGSSSRQVEAGLAEQRKRADRMDSDHERLIGTQGRLADGQERLVEGQERLVEGQKKVVDGLAQLLRGQEEQTRILREASSFRPEP